MSWNNGLEKAKFEKEQEAQAKKYRAAGMSEEQIRLMYEFDKEEFKCRRNAAIADNLCTLQQRDRNNVETYLKDIAKTSY